MITRFILCFLATISFASAGDCWRIETDPADSTRGILGISREGYVSLDEAIQNFPAEAPRAVLVHIWTGLFFSRDLKSQEEIRDYLKIHFPVLLASALQSSGNLHNPRVTPLREPFEKAVLSTSFVHATDLELAKIGYKISRVSSEKFFIDKKTKTFFADIWLMTEKNR